MNNANDYAVMAEYNHWMNQKLDAICNGIPDAKRKENLGAFFNSIHGTLNHILVSDRIWLGRFTESILCCKNGLPVEQVFNARKQGRLRIVNSSWHWQKDCEARLQIRTFHINASI